MPPNFERFTTYQNSEGGGNLASSWKEQYWYTGAIVSSEFHPETFITLTSLGYHCNDFDGTRNFVHIFTPEML